MRKTKSFISLFIAAVLIFSSFAMMSATAAKSSGILCDCNADYKVDGKDVMLLRKHLANWDVEIDLKAADVNQDDKVDLKDLSTLRKALAEWFPIPTYSGTTQNPTEQPTDEPTESFDVPSNFPKEIAKGKNGDKEYDIISVNQVGYDKSAEKIAVFNLTNSTDTTVEAYVVNKNTGKAVYKATSAAKKENSVTGTYAAKFDFSNLKAAGTYYISTKFGRSYSFEIGDNVYQSVQNSMITAIYYNRCGCALDSKIVGSFYAHSACHTGDKKVSFVDKYVRSDTIGSKSYARYAINSEKTAKASDFSGGLHDAGDYGRYTTPANQVITDYLFTYQLFPDGAKYDIIKDNDKNLPDILDEARYEMEWLLKMQDPTTGGVYWRIATKEFTGWQDMPDNDSLFNGSGLYVSRVMMKSTAGFAGTAANFYTVFKDIDRTFAERCLTAAKKAYDFIKNNASDEKLFEDFNNASEQGLVTAGEYDGEGNELFDARSDIWYAYCSLFRATGEDKYHTDVKDYYNSTAKNFSDDKLTGIASYYTGGAGTLSYCLADKADATLKANLVKVFDKAAKAYKRTVNSDAYGSPIVRYDRGSNSAITNAAKVMAFSDYLNKNNNYEPYVRRVVSYLLGNNHVGYTFVTGAGENSPKNPHDRPSMAASKSGIACPSGWVVGGIAGDNLSYYDLSSNHETNEISIYWTSSATVSLAYIVSQDSK